MRKDVQRISISREKSERKRTQHNMIKQANPDGILSDKRSTKQSAFRRKNMSVRTLHTKS
jgi:hypothetical protein